MSELITRPFISVGKLFFSAVDLFVGAFARAGTLYALMGRIGSRAPTIVKTMVFTKEQMMSLGVASLPLVLVTSCFTGGVAVSQAAYMFSNIVPMTYLGTAVCKATVMELAPVLTALVMAGRMGASIAAELGSMKTNEQIEAMECLALDPIRYLIIPRVVAGLLKSSVFGGIITLMGCYHGLTAEGGAEGVGKATMTAVVSSAVLILIFDFIVAALIF